MKHKYIKYILAISILGFILTTSIFSSEHTDHSSCSHTNKNLKQKQFKTSKFVTSNEHAAHDHNKHAAKKDEHAGHDHSKHAAKKDEHAGHDHSSHAAKKDEHAGHDHSKHEVKKDEHAGHDHSNSAGKKETSSCDDEHSESEIVLTEAQKKAINLTILKAQKGTLQHKISIPGELKINEDDLAKIVPRVSGITLHAYKTLGDHVLKGETLAIIDSPELGEAKSDYYEKFNQLGFSKIDFTRARAIEVNVNKLLKALKKFPELKKIQNKKYGHMGIYRAKLMSKYAEYWISKRMFERKQKLFDEKISSENSFLEAMNSLEKANSELISELDNAEFEVKQSRFAADRTYKLNQLRLKSAERKLYFLGLSKLEINKIKTATTLDFKQQCIDELCDVDITHDLGEHFSKNIIISPKNGVIIKRGLAPGQHVDSNKVIFEIANLTKIWAIFQIPSKDITLLKLDDSVIVSTSNGKKTIGKISVISPIINEQTRTAGIRVVIHNENNNLWKPGLFVTGNIDLSTSKSKVLVLKSAVQSLKGKNVLFVDNGHGYEPQAVALGRSDRKYVEIISGIKENDTYVSNGSYELKAKLITNSLGDHAGHNH